MVRHTALGKLKNKKTVSFLILTAFALCGSAYYLRANNVLPAPVAEAPVITYSTDTPDETKPDSSYTWVGKPTYPKSIHLPSIQTEGFIQNVGVDQNSQVAVPNNVHIAGWFKDSVLPGEKGLSIIDGHVDGRQVGGIFRQLQKLKERDTYQIEFGSGVIKSFIVKKVLLVEVKDVVNVLFSQDPKIVRQLNLITCGGTFDQSSRQYNKRVIVISESI